MLQIMLSVNYHITKMSIPRKRPQRIRLEQRSFQNETPQQNNLQQNLQQKVPAANGKEDEFDYNTFGFSTNN